MYLKRSTLDKTSNYCENFKNDKNILEENRIELRLINIENIIINKI